MTTNQTINGALRKPEWCEALLKLEVVREALTSSDSAERLKNMDAGKVLREGIATLKELRALLDKEVSGDSRAPLPQGKPVAHTLHSVAQAVEASDCYTVLTSNQCHSLARSLNKQQARNAEQPAPVAVVPEDWRTLADRVMEIGQLYWKAAVRERGPGAVQWLHNEETGAMFVFTRGEYVRELKDMLRTLPEYNEQPVVNEGKARDVQPCCGSCPGGCVYGLKA